MKLEFKWTDPDLAEKAAAFFLGNYRESQNAGRSREEQPATAAAPQAAVSADQGVTLELSPANVDGELLSAERFIALARIYDQVGKSLSSHLSETDDPQYAAVVTIQRLLLFRVRAFIGDIRGFLLLSTLPQPGGGTRRLVAAGPIEFHDDENGGTSPLKDLAIQAVLANLITRSQPLNCEFTEELQLMKAAGDTYLSMLAASFPVTAIGKCQVALTRLTDCFGTMAGIDAADNFVRRRQTMYREINAWQRGGNQPGPLPDELLRKMDEMSAAIAANTRTVANMDRRQKTILAHFKTFFDGFLALLKSGKPITRERARETLAPADRYACLSRYEEPRRSQLKTVIDFTVNHPIVPGGKTSEGLTLYRAVLAVWNDNYRKWELITGTYASFEALKTACYDLQQCKDNPFCYVQ